MAEKKIDWITAKAAAEIIGCDASHVRRLCGEGKLQARHFANVWQVSRESAQEFAKTEPTVGRPRGS